MPPVIAAIVSAACLPKTSVAPGATAMSVATAVCDPLPQRTNTATVPALYKRTCGASNLISALALVPVALIDVDAVGIKTAVMFRFVLLWLMCHASGKICQLPIDSKYFMPCTGQHSKPSSPTCSDLAQKPAILL